MTPKERAAMQQALIYLDAIINGEGVKPYQLEGTAFTLREALANSLKPKCFADYQQNHAIDRVCASCAVAVECQTGEQAEQEPVVKIHKYNEFQTLGSLNLPIGTKLYATPVRTKDLTDDEIRFWIGRFPFLLNEESEKWVIGLARVVIAADREKNK